MSASIERATRRDLRRAVGEEAVQLIEAHERGLKAHASSLQRHERQLSMALARTDDLDARVRKAHQFAASIAQAARDEDYALADVLRRRTFAGRLRWLLTGK